MVAAAATSVDVVAAAGFVGSPQLKRCVMSEEEVLGWLVDRRQGESLWVDGGMMMLKGLICSGKSYS